MEIDAAVDRFSPVTPDHPFYVDFKDLRGDFQEREVMRILNVRRNAQSTYEFDYRSEDKLGNIYARYLEPDDFEMLKKLKVQLDAGSPIGFNANIQSLLEKEMLFEYNDGTYKSVNPLLERSKLYKYSILDSVS